MPKQNTLTNKERSTLMQWLVALPDPQYKLLVFSINPPAGILPADSSPQAERVVALLRWAESNGPGLLALSEELGQITGQRLVELAALNLHDILQQSLKDCRTEDDKNRLRQTIDLSLRRCNPNGIGQDWRNQLLDLHLNRAPVDGWEAERPLVYFAVMLAWMKDTPTKLHDQLEEWVTRQNGNFPELLTRLNREMKQQRVSGRAVCEHLMVAIERDEISDNDLRVSMWAILKQDADEEESSAPTVSPVPLALVQNETLNRHDLPQYIFGLCREKFGQGQLPTIHCFVPRALLCCDVDMQPFGRLKQRLGSVYPFVIRTNLAVHPIGRYYYDDWHEKWTQIKQVLDHQTRDVLNTIECHALSDENEDALNDLMDQLADQSAVVLTCCDSFEELFELLAGEKYSALPLALWSRTPDLEHNLPNLLDGLLRRLPSRIQEERQNVERARDQNMIGHHLSLMWEDPTVVPPDMQFDPEAC
jgi:hypothetical protein